MSLKSSWARIDPSPWPLCLSVFLVGMPVGFVVWAWGGGISVLGISMLGGIIMAFGWAGDVISEGTFTGTHSSGVSETMAFGMLLFICSEVMFFFAFLWGWAHNAWVPSTMVGGVFPPAGVSPVNPMGLPFFNLASLVWSSGTVNLANGYVRVGNHKNAVFFLMVTLVSGLAFELAQLREYQRASFGISDSFLGSSFFLLTGFHGAHVMGGMGFLLFNLLRMVFHQYHWGMNISWVASVWYWHFVDVIWVFLWVGIYSWGVF